MSRTTKPSYSELEGALIQERQARTRAEQRLHDLTRDHRFNNRVYSANRLVLELQDAQRDRELYKEKLQTAENAAREWQSRATELEKLDAEVSHRCRMEKALFQSSLNSARKIIDDLQLSLAAAEGRYKITQEGLREERDATRRRLLQVAADHDDHAAKLKEIEYHPSASSAMMLEGSRGTLSLSSTGGGEERDATKPTLRHKKKFTHGVQYGGSQ
ncbi:hypothetical protein QC763_405785 [Podospora pseudopauciseta]|uniref:Uncharacterized protein n=1 Tax=Podospora pseudopauciseta TaxID=2093780 RepID=A0ABR0HE08_9PEZI|nr:hypothetical protein QC763_405785 [Podospora pseudopauciseta]